MSIVGDMTKKKEKITEQAYLQIIIIIIMWSWIPPCCDVIVSKKHVNTQHLHLWLLRSRHSRFFKAHMVQPAACSKSSYNI